jgi:uncharacterized protein involved in exopolysaccharide biosynthesis
MPISEERKQQMKSYRTHRKEKQRFYFEKYVAKHPEYAEKRRDKYYKKKEMYQHLLNLHLLVQTLVQNDTLTDTEKLQQIVASLKEKEEDVTNE